MCTHVSSVDSFLKSLLFMLRVATDALPAMIVDYTQDAIVLTHL